MRPEHQLLGRADEQEREHEQQDERRGAVGELAVVDGEEGEHDEDRGNDQYPALRSAALDEH